MFGGFIKHSGNLERISKNGEISELHISFSCEDFHRKLSIGRSVAVNGACLTVTSFSSSSFSVECTRETLTKTALKDLAINSPLNLELPITLDTLLDGHLVSGHVDTVGRLKKVSKFSKNIEMTFSFEGEYRKNLVEKGSVSINGISLTVFCVKETSFTVSVIPHTYEETNLGNLKENSPVNLEFDMIGKYVLNMDMQEKGGISMETLSRHGFL